MRSLRIGRMHVKPFPFVRLPVKSLHVNTAAVKPWHIFTSVFALIAFLVIIADKCFIHYASSKEK